MIALGLVSLGVTSVKTFAALEAAASEWSERGGWMHLWMWGKGSDGDFTHLPGGYDKTQSKRLNRHIAARLGPVPGWSMGIGWDVEFWIDQTKLKWWLDGREDWAEMDTYKSTLQGELWTDLRDSAVGIQLAWWTWADAVDLAGVFWGVALGEFG